MKRYEVLDEKQMSVTFGFYARNGYYSSAEAFAEVDYFAQTGIKWVVLVATVAQESYCSTVQFKDFELTPSDEELIGIINYLHSKGIKVQLRPMLETLDGHGRLSIWFPPDRKGTRVPGRETSYWEQWFASMKRRAVYYAKIAERTGCEIYCIDSELDRTIGHNSKWKDVVSAVREVYSGPVTSCHTSHTGIVNFEAAFARKDHWFYDLDFLSISCYHPAACKENTPVDEMIKNYKSQLERFRGYANTYGKPILFGECGCTSSVGGARWPSAWESQSDYSAQEQANYMTAVVETFKKEPWWMGLCWWKWDQQNKQQTYNEDPNLDKGFIIKGKLAEKVLVKYTKEFSKE